MTEDQLPSWVGEGKKATAVQKVARFLWVLITRQHMDKTEEEKGELWVSSVPISEKEVWYRRASRVLEAVKEAERSEEPPPPQDIARETRIILERHLRLLKQDLFSRVGNKPGKDLTVAGMEAKRDKARKEVPKVVQAVKDMVRTEMDLQEKNFAAWAALTPEEQVDSFIAAAESWPSLAKEYLAAKVKEHFTKAFHKAQAGLKAVGDGTEG